VSARAPAPGETLDLEVLGRGRVTAVVTARDPLDWHGIPGMAWRVSLRLPGGERAQAIQVGAERLTFLDPTVRAA
jgi:hypothetical protein